MKTMSNTPEEMPDNATDRPLVTFALFAYNQEDYIREAVEGAFAQTYEPLEIISVGRLLIRWNVCDYAGNGGGL